VNEHCAGEDPGWLVVDAMNVIGSRPTGWWRNRPGAIRDLVDKLRRYAEQTGAVTVVIDGRPLPDLPEEGHGPLEVRYARRKGRNAADDRIVELLEERRRPARVVTADADLRERVEALGATTVGPGQLLRALDRLPDSGA
jgi:predicted RNA-binding protein with PIN domain